MRHKTNARIGRIAPTVACMRAKGGGVSGLIPRTEYGPTTGPNYEFLWDNGIIQARLASHVGKKRKNNEDSCILCAPQDEGLAEERGLLFGVADGMGGASAGEYASRVALRVLVEQFYTGAFQPIPVALREAIARANDRIFGEAELNPMYAGMGTTVSVLVVHGEWAYVAQVGDSRVYLLRERSGIHQVTRDHSLVAEQVRNGILSEQEARNHSLKNLITRAVGIKNKVKADLFAFRMKLGDTILLCSDGLSNIVPDAKIADALAMADLRSGVRMLIERALDGGGTDNITAVTVRVIDSPVKTAYQEGAEEVNIDAGGFLGRLRSLFS